MKFSSYFIDRPVFASVLSAFILITGAIALFKLPVSEYPEVVPPSVEVRAAYPGANPKIISETVAAPLEQEIVGGPTQRIAVVCVSEVEIRRPVLSIAEGQGKLLAAFRLRIRRRTQQLGLAWQTNRDQRAPRRTVRPPAAAAHRSCAPRRTRAPACPGTLQPRCAAGRTPTPSGTARASGARRRGRRRTRDDARSWRASSHVTS